MNPMIEEITDKEAMIFAVELLAHNLMARGLLRENIPFVVYTFQKKLNSFYERTEYDQTS